MTDRLPPLTALRAFDAAARHMSFADAAAELNVTPAALSFQIKSLEQHLGQPVFRRLNRSVELTEAGRALAPGAAEAFQTLGAAWRSARRMGQQRTLTVTAGPAFTSFWLAPRLFAFASRYPDIEMRFLASLKIMDFTRDEVDVAIRFSLREDTSLYSRKFFDDWMTPMVAPHLADSIRTPADLAAIPLLHQDDHQFLGEAISWAGWFRAVGMAPPGAGGLHFNQADHAISAALAGTGAILGRGSLTQRLLTEGRLVMPFAETLLAGAAFRAVTQKGAETRTHIARFIDWVAEEMAELEPLTASRRFVTAPEKLL